MRTPLEGARTQIYCAITPELEDRGGGYFDDCREKAPSALANDDRLAEKLWERSEQLLSIQFLSGAAPKEKS